MDANILIAAFLRDSTVRRIITLSFLDLFVPEFLWEEMDKHLPELRRRAGLSASAARDLLDRLREYVTEIPAPALLHSWDRARDAMASVDSRDADYVAAALAIPCDGLWSDDPHLKRQGLVPCWNTSELVAALGPLLREGQEARAQTGGGDDDSHGASS